MTRIALALLASTSFFPQDVFGQADKYQVTSLERAACSADAVSLCSADVSDADQLLACMRHHEVQLSAICLPVFKAGLRRRHLN
jgi:hypothetical protein